jgi:hypothetical protein
LQLPKTITGQHCFFIAQEIICGRLNVDYKGKVLVSPILAEKPNDLIV